MKKADFEKAIRECPYVTPVFELVRIPEWTKTNPYVDVKIGDRFWVDWRGDLKQWGKRGGESITASYLKFVGYEEIDF